MAAVRNLADQNRTILCTIHSPSREIFALFDTCLILAMGRTIYFGPVRDVVKHFTQSPFAFQYQKKSNPAEFVIAIAGGFALAKDSVSVPPEALIENYFQRQGEELERGIAEEVGLGRLQSMALTAPMGDGSDQQTQKLAPAVVAVMYPTSLWHQIKVLTRRNCLKKMRSRKESIVATIR